MSFLNIEKHSIRTEDGNKLQQIIKMKPTPVSPIWVKRRKRMAQQLKNKGEAYLQK